MGGRGTGAGRLNRRSGPITDLSKSEQLNIILSSNPAQDDTHTWIRDESDILTFKESVQDIDYDPYPDYTYSDIQTALQTGKITVYSSYPINNGIFVTPSAMEAASYSGDGTIYTATINTSDVAWIDEGQGQLATRGSVKFKRISSRGLI